MSLLASEIVSIAQQLEAKGLNQGCSGNVSARCEGGFLITPSGITASALQPDQLVFMTMDGEWSGDWKPSSEWRFHRDTLQNRSDINAVVHCHSPAATALSVLGRDLPAFHYMVAIAGGCKIPCAAYATFGTAELSHQILTAMGKGNACFLAHHGQVSCGKNLKDAFAVAVEIEHLSDIYLRLLPLGEPPRLSDEEMSIVLEKFKTYGGNSQKESKI